MQHACVETGSVLQKRKRRCLLPKQQEPGMLVFNCRGRSRYRNLFFVIIDVYQIG